MRHGFWLFTLVAALALSTVRAQTEATVALPTGWNLVSNSATPFGTALASTVGPIYCARSAAPTSFDVIPANYPMEGEACWVYVGSPTSVVLGSVSPQVPHRVPAPGGQWTLIGKPSASDWAMAIGLALVYVYDPAAGCYEAAARTPATFTATSRPAIPPGRGAWAYSARGNAVTVTPVGAINMMGSSIQGRELTAERCSTPI